MKGNRQASAGKPPIERIVRLLGDAAVLLPVAPLQKGCKLKGWTSFTTAKMKDPRYLELFRDGYNIGAALGAQSNGLISIDLDAEKETDIFFELNPWARESLISTRKRGCNTWFQLTDSKYPRSFKLKRPDGTDFGEVRSTGSQTVIWGKAIDRRKGETEPTAYRYLREAEPIRCSLAAIRLPYGITFAPNEIPPSAEVTTEGDRGGEDLSEVLSLDSVSLGPVYLYDSLPTKSADDILRNIADAEEVDHVIEGHAKDVLGMAPANLQSLYQKLMQARFKPRINGRNAFITEAIPFLFVATAPTVALELSMLFFRMHQPLFKDPPEDHEHQTKAMLETCEDGYWFELNKTECRVYEALKSESERTVFRIIRDLVCRSVAAGQSRSCHMSADQLGKRLGVDKRIAHRLLQKFVFTYQLLSIIKLGQAGPHGRKLNATVYGWLLPLAETGNAGNSEIVAS